MRIQNAFKILLMILILETYKQQSLNPQTKQIQAQSIYSFQILTFVKQASYQLTSVITFDFSQSQLGITAGTLTTCKLIDQNQAQTTISPCSCTAAKICSITLSATINTLPILTVYFGPLTNPLFIYPSQTVYYTINTSPAQSNTINIDGNSYSAGSLTLTSMTQASQVVAVYSRMTILFKLQHFIPANGQIQIFVPVGTNDQDMKFDTPTTINVQIYNNPIQNSVTTSNSASSSGTTYTILNSNSILQSQINVDSSNSITLVINNIRNPLFLGTSATSIQITTMNSNSYIIDQISSSIQAVSSVAASINFISISSSTRVVGVQASFTIAILPQNIFQTGGYLRTVFPADFTLTAGVNCNFQFGLQQSSDSGGSCSVSGNNVNTVNMFYPDSTQNIIFMVNSVNNPLSTKPTASFLFQIYDSNNNLLSAFAGSSAAQYTATVQTMVMNTGYPIRSSNLAGQVTKLTISITTTTLIYANSIIQIMINNNYLQSANNGYSCNKIVNGVSTSVSCAQVASTASSFTIQLTEFCSGGGVSCAAGSTMVIEVASGLINPVWTMNNLIANIITVTTLTAADVNGNSYSIDAVSSSLSPVLTPQFFSTTIFTRSVSEQCGQNTVWTASITGLLFSQFITLNGNFIIYFPRQTICNPLTSSPICTVIITSNFVVTCTISYYSQTTAQAQNEPCQSIQSIQFNNICGTASNCASINQAITLQVSQVRNYLEAVNLVISSSNFFAVLVNNLDNSRSLQYQQATTTNFNQLTFNPFNSFSVVTSNLITGSLATYTFTLNPNQEFPQSGYYYLTLATEQQMPSTVACSATVNGFSGTCSVDTANKRVMFNFNSQFISNSITKNTFISTSTIIQIVIQNCNNPYSTKPSSNIVVQSFSSSNIIMQQSSTIVTMTTANQFVSASIVRSVQQVSQAVTLTLSMQISNQIAFNTNYLLISLALDQVVVTNPSGLVINSVLPTANSQSITYTIVSSNSNYLQIQFNLLYCPCTTANQQLRFTIGGAITNPISTAIPTLQNTITTYQQGAYIQDTSSLQMTPIISGGILQFTVVNNQGNNVNTFSLITYTFTITLQNPIPNNGIITITFPDNLLYYQGSTNVLVSQLIGGTTTQLTSSTSTNYNTNPNFNFLNIVKIMNACNSGCVANQQLVITIYNQLLSMFSTVDLTSYSNVVISSFDSGMNIIDSGSILANNFKSNTVSEFSNIIFTRSSTVPGIKTVTLTVQVTLANVIVAQNSILRITIPNDQIILIDNSQSNSIVCNIYISNVLQSAATPCSIVSYSASGLVIDINEFCSNSQIYCSNNSILKFQISNIQNPLTLPSSMTSYLLMAIYKTSLANQQFQQLSSVSNKRISPELALSDYSNIQISLSNTLVNYVSNLQIQVTILSPIPAGGVFQVSISSAGFLLSVGSQCQIATGNILTDPVINYVSNACTFTTLSQNSKLYYGQINLATVCNNICITGTQFIINIQGKNQYYSQSNTGTLTTSTFSSSGLGISRNVYQLSNIVLNPYTLTNINIQRSSSSLNSPVSLTITFSLPIDLIASSTLYLTIPQSQLVLISSQSLSSIQCNLLLPQVQSITCSATSDTYNFFVTFLVNFCSSQDCLANTQISIVIQNNIFQNPSSVLNVLNNLNYQPVSLIAYYNTNTQLIFKSIQPLSILPTLQLQTLNQVLIQRSNGLIQIQSASIYIQIQLALAMANSDKIQIQFPVGTVYGSNYLTNTNNINVYQIQNMNTYTQVQQLSSTSQVFQQDAQNMYYLYSLVINNYCSSSCAVNSYIYLQLNNFQNPFYLQSDINNRLFTISITNSANQITQQSIVNSQFVIQNLIAQSLSSVSITRSVQSINTATLVTVQFTNSGFQILQNSNINLIIPISQFVMNSNNGLVCTNTLNNQVINNCYIQANTTHLNITMAQYCSLSGNCAANTQLSFSIQGLKNPLYQASQSSQNGIQINLINGYQNIYAQQQNIFPSPNLNSGTSLTQLQLSRNNNVAGQNVLLNVVFQVPANLPSTSQIIVQLPAYAFYLSTTTSQCLNSNGVVLNCNFVLNSNSLDQRLIQKYVTQIVISNLCSVQVLCSQNTIVTIQIQLRNQISTADYLSNSQFVYLVLDVNNNQLYQGFLSNSLSTISAGIFSSNSFSSSTLQIKQSNNLCLSSTLTNTFSSQDYQGKLIVTIPLVLTTVQSFTCVVTFPSIPALTMYCNYNAPQTLIISYFQSVVDLSGKTIQICMNQIMNPNSNAVTSSFILLSQEYIDSKQMLFTIDSTNNGITYQATVLGNLIVTSCTRLNTLVQTDTIVNLDFTTTNSVPSNSLIQIQIQQSMQIEFRTGQSLVCFDKLLNVIVSCTSDATSIYLNTFCANGCTANKQFSIQIQSGVKNVNYVYSQDQLVSNNYYIKIFTTLSDNSQVDGNSNILITPYLQQGSITLISFTKTNNFVFDYTSVLFQLKSQSIIYANNILTLSLPNNFLQDDYNFQNQITCFKMSSTNQIIQQQACTIQVYSGSQNREIQQVMIQNICSVSNGCGSNYQIGILMNQIRNVGYYKIMSSTSQVSLMFQALTALNSYANVDSITVLQSTYFQTLSQSNMTILQINLNNPAPAAITTLTFTLSLNAALYTGSYLKITFPSAISTNNPQFQCNILTPISNAGTCSSQASILTISSAINNYINTGNVIFSIKNFVNPPLGTYQGFQISSFTSDNNLIVSSTAIDSNLGVTMNIFNQFDINQCSGYCQTCGPKDSQCLSCYNPGVQPLYDPMNKQCLSKCKDGQYLQEIQSNLQSVLNNYQCIQCFDNCLTCFGPSSNMCSSCKTGQVFSQGSCINANQCPLTSQVIDGKCQLVQSTLCTNNCLTCGPDKTFCYSCKTGFVLDKMVGSCVENKGADTQCTIDNNYYDVITNSCQPCPIQCATCSSATICLTCNTFFGNFYQYNGQCVSSCPNAYYADNNQVCQPCISNCNSCVDGSSCYDCKQPYMLLSSNSQCVKSCPTGFTYKSSSNLCTNQQCNDVTCFQCSSLTPQVCTACSLNLGYNILLNGKCLTATAACDPNNIMNYRLTLCQKCNIDNCNQCVLTQDQVYQKCQTCGDNFWLYKGYCYSRCPQGTQYSINYNNDPKFIKQCLVISCEDANCKYCNQLSLKCYNCNNGYSLLNTNCINTCPQGYQTISTSNGLICKNVFEGNPGIYSYIIWIIIVIFTLIIIISLILRKHIVTTTSSIVALFTIVELLIRFGILVQIYNLNFINFYIVGLDVVIIFTNCGIGLLFKLLYITLYEENLKAFSNFKFSYYKFYIFAIIGQIFFGILFSEIFVCGILKFPIANFYKIRPYRKNMLTMQLFSILLSCLQMIVYIYIIVTNIYVQNGIWYQSITGMIISVIVIVCFAIRKVQEVQQSDTHLIKPTNDNYQKNQINNYNNVQNQDDISNF